MGNTWSSEDYGVGVHYLVDLYNGYVAGHYDRDDNNVSCVH